MMGGGRNERLAVMTFWNYVDLARLEIIENGVPIFRAVGGTRTLQ
jgi:hypothetical protein